LVEALGRHGVPEQILTDNGKVFTARFGLGPGPVLFDKVCQDNGIRHLLTAPYSPTTTGKVERLHKTIRRYFLSEHDRIHVSIAELQEALDAWVVEYNTERPHQSCGRRPPAERFALGRRDRVEVAEETEPATRAAVRPKAETGRPPGVSRWVDGNGQVSLAGFKYRAGATFAGEPVEVVVVDGLVEIWHRGVLVATHAQRVKPDQADRVARVPVQRRARDATVGLTVTRIVDASGALSFAGAMYRAGMAWRGQSVQVSIVAGSVQLAKDGRVIRVHPIRHDRFRELGAFANPGGRPRKTTPV
jgi:hypothetical protein